MRTIFSFILFLMTFYGAAQSFEVKGRVKAEGTMPTKATVFVEELNIRSQTDDSGYFKLEIPKGEYTIAAYQLGKAIEEKTVEVSDDTEVNFYLKDILENLEEVIVTDFSEEAIGVTRLRSIEGFGIYEAKKTEIIRLDDFAANKVANNARQVFAKVPGLNIWESDFAGLQLDIAARGLGPSRTANFNTRQNGYDMSADALGYPESYYMPAMQAVDRIEVVRGAASLQYGTQFGGMLNFRLKEASTEPIEVNLEQAIGSFGLVNSFASVSGTKGKLDYYGYYQFRQGDGWRQNSGFDSHLAFSRLGYRVNDKLKLGFEYSLMDYQAQQPGGLTDEDFRIGRLDTSRRGRNWFQVQWNLLAATMDYEFSPKTKLNIRSFKLISNRDALGNLEQIDRLDDPGANRTLIADQFNNFGSEVRLLHYFDLFGGTSALLSGARYYQGMTDRQQGNASSGAGPEFSFVNPEDLEDFDYDFPSRNYALFFENVLNVTPKLSLTPGVRFEHIRTDAEGTWKQVVRDFAGNITTENTFQDEKSVARSFVLFGLGASYHLKEDLNIYANASENYRSVTFSDLRLNNPNFLLDSLITDETGYNTDLGIRGNLNDWLSMDVSVFYLRYNDRIGVLLPPASTLLFRTNVGDSRHVGLESFFEVNVFRLLDRQLKDMRLSLFSNLSLIDATYVASEDPAIKGRKVEYVPGVMFRSGINYQWKELKTTFQFSYLGEQYSDATNSISNPNALTGLIPDYHVMDFSVEYTPARYKFSAGINNLTDQTYFTRRAESYPGPGIIPATPRSFYLSMGVRF